MDKVHMNSFTHKDEGFNKWALYTLNTYDNTELWQVSGDGESLNRYTECNTQYRTRDVFRVNFNMKKKVQKIIIQN
jgi:hypothetical protein